MSTTQYRNMNVYMVIQKKNRVDAVLLDIGISKLYWSKEHGSRMNILDSLQITPLTVKLFKMTFHPLKVVSRWRDSQFQVSKNRVQHYFWLLSRFIISIKKKLVFNALINK